jgi:hypothetical protein
VFAVWEPGPGKIIKTETAPDHAPTFTQIISLFVSNRSKAATYIRAYLANEKVSFNNIENG